MSDSEDDTLVRSSKRPRTSLTQLFAEDVPQRDTIPNSCSEGESDDDDDVTPIPLPIPKAVGDKKIPSWLLGESISRSSSPVAGPSKLVPVKSAYRTPLPQKRPMANIQTTPGYGGRIVYTANQGDQKSNYYCVQW